MHLVSEELGSGGMIAKGGGGKDKDLENYESKIHKLEHYLYPLAVLEALKKV